jgi:hypothetical protein
MLTWLSTFVEYSKIKKGCPFKTASFYWDKQRFFTLP